jgi:hypothetical protein
MIKDIEIMGIPTWTMREKKIGGRSLCKEML